MNTTRSRSEQLWPIAGLVLAGGGIIIISASIAHAMMIGAVVGVMNADAMDKWNLLIALLSLWVIVTAITHLVRGRTEVAA
jgi:hypothetical protein